MSVFTPSRTKEKVKRDCVLLSLICIKVTTKFVLYSTVETHWVNLIMQCVSTVEYKVRNNEDESESSTPTRGFTQGDPLSPYLFLLCTQGLNALLAHAEENENILGVKVC